MNYSNSTQQQQQHVQIREALSAALANKPLVAQEAFLKFPNATDEIIEEEQKQSMLRRFRSLSMNTKEHTAWSEDTVKRKYPTEKTVELYGFSSEFETADLNQMLEPYQHTRCERGGYRIKWLNDTRALAVFRRAETAQRVLDDLSTSQLAKTKNYVFSPGDLDDFNKKYNKENGGGKSSNATSATTSVNASETGSPFPAFDEEHIRYKYRPEVTIELHDFSNPLETTDLQNLFAGYKRDDNIVRIKWFNRNRALAWFTNPTLATEALESLKTCTYLHVKTYMFDPSDMKYFNPDHRMLDMSGTGGGIARRRTISGGSGLARRNTVSGASHYQRGHLYASAVAAQNMVPSIPSTLSVPAGSNVAYNTNSTTTSVHPPLPLRNGRSRRFSKSSDNQ